MNRIAASKLGVAATAAALGLHICAVSACGYHSPMVDLVVAHPRSIEVALAVRDAYDHGELHALAPVPPVLGLVRANGMLQSFRPLVSAVAGSPNTSVAVLLIEEGLWARYSMSAAGMATELHVGGPRDGEPVIVTSESALHALLGGTLTPTRATEMGVLVVVRST
jgi:hypothetical protein